MKRVLALAMVLPLVIVSTDAFAHNGHGNPRWAGSIIHYLLEPVHLLQAAVAAAGLVLLLWQLIRERFCTKSCQDV